MHKIEYYYDIILICTQFMQTFQNYTATSATCNALQCTLTHRHVRTRARLHTLARSCRSAIYTLKAWQACEAYCWASGPDSRAAPTRSITHTLIMGTCSKKRKSRLLSSCADNRPCCTWLKQKHSPPQNTHQCSTIGQGKCYDSSLGLRSLDKILVLSFFCLILQCHYVS